MRSSFIPWTHCRWQFLLRVSHRIFWIRYWRIALYLFGNACSSVQSQCSCDSILTGMAECQSSLQNHLQQFFAIPELIFLGYVRCIAVPTRLFQVLTLAISTSWWRLGIQKPLIVISFDRTVKGNYRPTLGSFFSLCQKTCAYPRKFRIFS